MKNFWIAAALAWLASTRAASAQDELDARLEELGGRLSREGPSARLAELCGSLWGRAAIREKIDALVNHRAGRLDRDAQGHWEEHLFARDETGALRLRPERRAEFERLAADVAAAPRRMDAFNRRVFELVARIDGDGELEKEARAWWSDSAFRIAFFHSRPDELHEMGPDEILHELLGKGFVRKEDGRLRAEGPHKDEVRERIQSVYAQLDQVKELEKEYLRNLADLPEETRIRLVTDRATLFILGRLTRQVNEGVEGAIGTVADQDTGEKGISFHVPLADLLAPFQELEAVLAEVRPWFEKTAQALSGAGVAELEALDFLKNERARVLVVERLLALRAEQRARSEAVFAEILADGFEARDDKLVVKKGRYVNENQEDSAEVMRAEHKSVVDGFWRARYAFDLAAELAIDPKVSEVLGSAAGTIALQEHVGRYAAERRREIEAQGLELFTKLYLVSEGGSLNVRPERAARIDALAVRAAQIKRDSGP